MITISNEQKKAIIYLDNIPKIILDKQSLSTISNKFQIICTYIENFSKNIPGFDVWLIKFLEECEASDNRFPIIEKNIEFIKYFSDTYIDSRDIDFSKFSDANKSKKNSILFTGDEIERIARLSGYLKIYALISNSNNLRIDQRLHVKIYNLLATDITEDISYKIFNVVKTKTFRYNMTDRFMWDYIKMIQCKSIDNHVIHIYNIIMNQIFILCEEDKNPITYFVSIVDESVKWFLKSVYKSSVVYDDSISTEDIQSSSKHNLKTYCYNDTLGRLKGIAYTQIHRLFDKPVLMAFDDDVDPAVNDKFIIEFQNRVADVKYISPLCEHFIYPILSKVTGVPYHHMKTLSPEHSIILSTYLQNIMIQVFGEEYKTIISLMSYYPKSEPPTITTYKIKNIQHFVNYANEVSNFFGFKTMVLLYEIISNFVGKVARLDFINIMDGRELGGIPMSKIENEMIDFYINLFSNKLDSQFLEMKRIIENDF